MTELSRDEALVAAAVLASLYYKTDDGGVLIHDNTRVASAVRWALDSTVEIRSALAGEEKTDSAERRFWDDVRRRDNEVVKYLTELGAANTAFESAWITREEKRRLESKVAALERERDELKAKGEVAAIRVGARFYGKIEELRAEALRLSDERNKAMDERDALARKLKEAEGTIALIEPHRNALQIQLAKIREAAGE